MPVFKRFTDDQNGATAVEYGMIVGLFAVAILGWASVAGDNIDSKFIAASDALDDAEEPGVSRPVVTSGGD